MRWIKFASLFLACVAAVPADKDFDMERDLHTAKVPHTIRTLRAETSRDCTTNAECLRKRMPLLPPRPKRSGPMRPRASPCVVQTYKGYLQAYNASTNAPMGYLSARRGVIGAYGVFTSVSLAVPHSRRTSPRPLASSLMPAPTPVSALST